MGYEMPDDEDIVCDSGTLKGDTSCNPKSCHLPIIENIRNNADKRVISHNQQLNLICKGNYTLWKDGNELPSGKMKTTCILGNLTRSIDGLECVPKRCEIPQGKQAVGDNNRYTSGDLVNSGKAIRVTCPKTKELYFNETNQYRIQFSSACTFGDWNNPTFPVCTNKRCLIPQYDGTTYTANGKPVTAAIKVDDGTKLTKFCDIGYEMPDDEDSVCDSGTLKGDTSCNPKSCHLPLIENIRNNADKRVISHNQQLNLICKGNNYTLWKDGNELPSGKMKTTCILGNLTRSIDGLECVPKGCQAVQNAYLYKSAVNGLPEDEISTTFDHNQHASINCKEHFSLVKNRQMLSETVMTTICSFGRWDPRYRCRKSRCSLNNLNGLLVDGRKTTRLFKIYSGEMVKLTCPAKYSLYNKTGNVTYDEYNVSCIGVTLSAPLPICVKGNPDNPESVTAHSPIEAFTMDSNTTTLQEETSQQATVQANDENEGTPDNPDSVTPDSTTKASTMDSNTTTPLEDTSQQTTLQANDETEDNGNDVVTTTHSADENEYDEYGYYGNYQDNENAEAEDEVKCKTPENGMKTKFFTNSYKFTCNDGYTLKSNGGEINYECSDGKLKSKKYGKEPKCTEKSCTLTREVLQEMNVFSINNSKKKIFDAGEKLYFNCKDANMEPTNRRFQCIKGIWTAAEPDPNWKMTIHDTDPSCRQAVCKQMCEFGGTCIRDGKCACSPGSTGEFCQTLGCTLPDVPQTVVINEIMKGTFFEIGATLPRDAMSCPTGYIISTDSSLICLRNNSWSGKPHCLEEAVYDVTIIVGNKKDHKWAGTWHNVEVSLSNQNGEKITVMFQGPLNHRTTHTYKMKAKYIGQIEKCSIAIKGTDDILITTLHVVVENANDIEEYKFSNVGVVTSQLDKRPDTGCPPPTFTIKSQKKKQRYIAGDELRDRDVLCPEELSLSSESITCLSTGQWSDTVSCVKAAGTRTYRIEINVKAHRGTKSKVEVVLHGKDGNSDKVTFSDHGLKPGQTTSRAFKLPNIGEVTRIRLTLSGKWRDPMDISYIHLTTQETNDEYLFFQRGYISGNTEIFAQKLFKPGCAGASFTHGHRGWYKADKGELGEARHDLESCKELCRKDNDCKAITTRFARNQYYHFIVKTNDLGKFVFNDNMQRGKFFFRKC